MRRAVDLERNELLLGYGFVWFDLFGRGSVGGFLSYSLRPIHFAIELGCIPEVVATRPGKSSANQQGVRYPGLVGDGIKGMQSVVAPSRYIVIQAVAGSSPMDLIGKGSLCLRIQVIGSGLVGRANAV
jgi:hypothetical protein